MEEKFVSFKLGEGVSLPSFESDNATGADITAQSIITIYNGNKEIEPEKLEKIRKDFQENGFINMRRFERVLFGTGLTVTDIHQGIDLQVRTRSGMALKRGLQVLNSPGTIDGDYRGEIGVILHNTTPFLNKVEKGERIAQLVQGSFTNYPYKDTPEATKSARGSGGFGSTGY